MVQVVFTPNLQRHIQCQDVSVAASTVRDALNAAFECNAGLAGYIVDEQGRTRKHIAIFVNGQPIRDRLQLTDPLTERDEVYVMQALSGG